MQVQVVNENPNRAAYFNNLTITQDPPVLVEEVHYDPWGLELTGITTAGEPTEDDKFQGKEHEESFGLDWDDFGARMYDSQLGRWHAVDPADQFASGYVGMGNQPTVGVDPDGRIVPLLVFGAAALIGGGLNALAHSRQIGAKSGWAAVGEFATAFGIGAVAGVAGAATGGAALAAYGTAAGAGGFVAGLASGAIGGATSSVIQGVGNAVAYGDAYNAKDLLRDTFVGAAFGGVANGIMAKLNGRNFWNGQIRAPGAGSFTMPGTNSTMLSDQGYVRVGKKWWNPLGGGSGKGGNLTYDSWQLPNGETVNSFGGASSGDIAARGSLSNQVGAEYEAFLVNRLGGVGGFKAGGKQFDGAYGNVWYEAKAGKFWSAAMEDVPTWRSKFGHAQQIAQQNGKQFRVFSDSAIPGTFKEYFWKKGIPFYQHNRRW